MPRRCVGGVWWLSGCVKCAKKKKPKKLKKSQKSEKPKKFKKPKKYNQSKKSRKSEKNPKSQKLQKAQKVLNAKKKSKTPLKKAKNPEKPKKWKSIKNPKEKVSSSILLGLNTFKIFICNKYLFFESNLSLHFIKHVFRKYSLLAKWLMLQSNRSCVTCSKHLEYLERIFSCVAFQTILICWIAKLTLNYE